MAKVQEENVVLKCDKNDNNNICQIVLNGRNDSKSIVLRENVDEKNPLLTFSNVKNGFRVGCESKSVKNIRNVDNFCCVIGESETYQAFQSFDSNVFGVGIRVENKVNDRRIEC